LLAGLLFGQAGVIFGAAESAAPSAASLYADLPATVALENGRVLVRRYLIQPGQATGREAHEAHELLIYVKGGVLTSKSTGRHSLWPDGRVVWFDRAAHDEGSTNTGSRPIEILWVVLKPVAAPNPGPKSPWGYLNYPNVAGEDVLENEWVIVQRIKLKPGEWEGVHAHNPNTFYVFIKGGQWLSKSKAHPNGEPGTAADGTVAWMEAIDLSQQHQSGNTGNTESDVVWVALKDRSP
jgi:quercetin dioxygenase-like cupin family protein